MIPVQGCGWLEPVPATQDPRWDPTLDRTLCNGRATHTHSHTHPDPHTHTLAHSVNHAHEPHMHSSGCGGNWSTWRKPRQTWEEHANSTQTVAQDGNRFLLSRQPYNEMELRKKTLFKDPLQSIHMLFAHREKPDWLVYFSDPLPLDSFRRPLFQELKIQTVCSNSHV